MKNRVLITGAEGFIARNIIQELKHKVEFIKVSRKSHYKITNLLSFENLKNIDIAIHCAAKTFIPDSFTNPYKFYHFNINSSLKVAEFCRLKKIKTLIFINAYPYGIPKYLPIDEKHPLEPHSPYNSSKIISEKLLIDYLNDTTNVISLRVFNVYGQYQNKNFLIPKVIKQIKNNEEIKLNDLRPKRDFLYIKDLVLLIENILISNSTSGVFNVGFGKSYSIEEIVKIISKLIQKDCKIQSLNKYRNNEILDLYSNIEKVYKHFNWSPSYSLEDGLNDYLKTENIK